MSISYKKLLKLLADNGITAYSIKKDKFINQETLQSIKKGYSISMTNLSKICERLHCQPRDLIEWEDDGKHNERPKPDK